MRRLLLWTLALLAACPGNAQDRMPAPGEPVPAQLLETLGTDRFFTLGEIPDTTFQTMQGKSYKAGCPVPREGLRYLRVLHKDAQGRTLVGEMVVSRSIADDLMEILRALYEASYPIERMVLVDTYDADDERSMRANNSSGFNFRYIRNTRIISRHGRGEAVDINPLYNPYCKRRSDGTLYVEPATAAAYTDRTAVFPYKIVRGDLCWRLFTEKGFEWGGDWQHCRDWQHFERPEKR